MNRISPFKLQIIYLIIVSFLVAVLADIFLNTIFLLGNYYVLYFQKVAISFSAFLIVLGLFLYISFIIKYRDIRMEQKDFRRNSFEEQNVYLHSSEPISGYKWKNIVDRYLNIFFHSERAVYQKCYIKSNDNGKGKAYFYIILTSMKIDAFRCLYPDLRVKYRDIGIWPIALNFDAGVPIKITYGVKSRVISKVACVEGHCYSKEQREAIEQLNKKFLGYYHRYIKGYSLFSSLKDKIVYHNGNLFRYMPIYILAISVVISTIICCGIVYGIDISLVYLESGIVGLSLYIRQIIKFFFVIFIFCCLPFSAGIIGDFIDGRKKQYIVRDIILVSSKSIGISDGYVSFFRHIYHDQNISLQKLSYKMYVGSKSFDSKKYVYFALSEDLLELLHELYDCQLLYVFTNERFGSLYQTRITFEGNIPLRIVLGEKGRVLKSVSAVPKFSYTEDQLAAIEKFNTLYP